MAVKRGACLAIPETGSATRVGLELFLRCSKAFYKKYILETLSKNGNKT